MTKPNKNGGITSVKILEKKETDVWTVVNKVLKGSKSAPVQPLIREETVYSAERLLNTYEYVGLLPTDKQEVNFWQIKEASTYDFDDKVIAKRLQDVHIRRTHATDYTFDDSFKEEAEKEIDEIISRLECQDPETWSTEDYNVNIADHEVQLDDINQNGSPGIDGLHPKMLKNGGILVKQAVLLLLQKCWQAAIFPTPLKLQNMIFLQKADKDDYNHEKAYRPISLTSILAKLLENVLARRLVAFLKSSGFFDNQPQFAYLKGMDTTQALLSMTLRVQDGFKRGEHTVAAFLDMEGAFDSVWRKGVILKLSKLGVTGRLLLIINDFFNNRYTKCMVNSCVTDFIKTDTGLPQGSILAVILILVYFGDISEDLSKDSHIKFADDMNVWRTDSSPNKAAAMLTQDLQIVYDWSYKWRMGISAPKSHIMCFSPKGHTAVTVLYNGKLLEQVREQRSLGVILDENLTFSTHIQTVKSKALSVGAKLQVFSNEIGGASAYTSLFLYSACVLPILEYCHAVWCSSKSVSDLQSVQYTCTRNALGAMDKSSHLAMERLAHLLPLDIRLDKSLLLTFISIYRKPDSYSLKMLINKLIDDPVHLDHRIITPIHKFKMASRSLLNFEPQQIEPLLDETISDILRKPPELVPIKSVFGKSGTRTTEQAESAKKDAENYINKAGNNIIAFTDGSALSNPGPTGAGAAIFLNGINHEDIKARRPVSAMSTSYHGELQGIDLALTKILQVKPKVAKPIHILSDCQSALEVVSSPKPPIDFCSLYQHIQHCTEELNKQGASVTLKWIGVGIQIVSQKVVP